MVALNLAARNSSKNPSRSCLKTRSVCWPEMWECPVVQRNEENAEPNRTGCVSLVEGGRSSPSVLLTHTVSSLSIGAVNATLLVLSAVPLSVGSELVSRAGPGAGFSVCSLLTRARLLETRLQLLWDPVRDGGNNYITLVFPGWLTLFKSPPWSLSLPSTSSVLFKKALYAASLLVSVLLFAAPTLLQESGGFLCRWAVGVSVKVTLRDDVGCGWITEDRFYIWTFGGVADLYSSKH